MENTAHRQGLMRYRKGIFLLVMMFAFSFSAWAQNTKGDKPSKPLPRVTQKTKKKPAKDRAKTRDISGRKLRTKNKSSTVRTIDSAPRRKPTQPSRGDRSVRSEKPVIKSTTAKAARNNVYPQKGPYVNNPSRKPKQKQPTYSNSSIVKQRTNSAARRSSNNVYPQKGPYVNNPSKRPTAKQPVYNNRSVVQRNVKRSQQRSNHNIFPQRGAYVNNPSRTPKDGKTIFNNRSFIAKALNLQSQSWPPGKGKGRPRSASGNYVTRGKKNVYWGKFKKGERAITTDIAGRRLRTKNYRSPAMGFIPATNPYAFRKNKPEGAYRGPFRFGFSSATRMTQRAWKGNISGHALRSGKPSKPVESVGQRFFPRKLSVSGSGKVSRLKGSGYQSRSEKGISNRPIPGKAPGIGASGFQKFVGRITGKKPSGPASTKPGTYQGNFKRGTLSPGFRDQGIGFAGNVKTKRPLQGGGSISGRSRNNGGLPINVKAPTGPNAGRIGTFQGNVKGAGKSFRNQGEGFSGNIRASRPLKGGGSVSGRSRNNGGVPVTVKAPTGRDAGRVGTYQGNLKGTGKNFRNQGEEFTGDIKGVGRTFRNQGEEFSGNIKASRPAKGGGSISGRSRNNGGRPVFVKAPTGKNAGRVGTFQGNAKVGDLTPGYRNQGEEFTGFTKTKKPQKGGGSVSGKLWNNNETPIDVRTPLAEDAKAPNYSGKMRLTRFKKAYVRNPNASELALKQRRPDETTYAVGGLQVKVKTGKYERNKKSSEGALMAIGPNNNSVKASEYSGRMKVYWEYKHNPSSSDDALKTIAGTSAFNKSTSYTGRVRLSRNYRHNPSSSKEALKTFAPGRSYARINDFQGNFKMKKYGGREMHPDTQFAHSSRNNVQGERTILTNIKLLWTKAFRKNSTHTKAVKQKNDRPRYDKNEKDLWKDLYD